MPHSFASNAALCGRICCIDPIQVNLPDMDRGLVQLAGNRDAGDHAEDVARIQRGDNESTLFQPIPYVIRGAERHPEEDRDKEEAGFEMVAMSSMPPTVATTSQPAAKKIASPSISTAALQSDPTNRDCFLVQRTSVHFLDPCPSSGPVCAYPCLCLEGSTSAFAVMMAICDLWQSR